MSCTLCTEGAVYLLGGAEHSLLFLAWRKPRITQHLAEHGYVTVRTVIR